MAYVDFIMKLHKRTKRNYLERVVKDKKHIVVEPHRLSFGEGNESSHTG